MKNYYLFIFCIIPLFGICQGPSVAFMHNQQLSIPWASAKIFFNSGASIKLGFVPIIDRYEAPFGSARYSKNIRVNSKLFFLSSIEYLKKHASQVKNSSVLIDIDSRHLCKEISFGQFIKQIQNLGAQCIILFSSEENEPFFRTDDEESANITIPVIAISHSSLLLIMGSSGLEQADIQKILTKPLEDHSRPLIGSFHLSINSLLNSFDGKYGKSFYTNSINSSLIKNITQLQDSAVVFLSKLFNNPSILHNRYDNYYFSDYFEKLFFTAHWGQGLSHFTGNYCIADSSRSNYQLIVHELTHLIFNKSLGYTSSFISEGLAMYAEDLALNSHNNIKESLRNLNSLSLMPLDSLLTFSIGIDEYKSKIAYYASGSFAQFLITNYGLTTYLSFWKSKDLYSSYKKTVKDIEIKWHQWLKESNTNQFVKMDENFERVLKFHNTDTILVVYPNNHTILEEEKNEIESYVFWGEYQKKPIYAYIKEDDLSNSIQNRYHIQYYGRYSDFIAPEIFNIPIKRESNGFEFLNNSFTGKKDSFFYINDNATKFYTCKNSYDHKFRHLSIGVGAYPLYIFSDCEIVYNGYASDSTNNLSINNLRILRDQYFQKNSINECINIYTGDSVENYLNLKFISERYNNIISNISERFNVPINYRPKIDVFIYNNREDLQRFLAQPGWSVVYGKAIGNQTHISGLNYPAIIHEIGHVIIDSLIGPNSSPFWNEGLRQYTDYLQNREALYNDIRISLENKNLITNELISGKTPFFSNLNHYPISGTFVKFIISLIGEEEFAKIYKSGDMNSVMAINPSKGDLLSQYLEHLWKLQQVTK